MCLLRLLLVVLTLYLYDKVVGLSIEHVLGLGAGIVPGKCNAIMDVTTHKGSLYKKNESLVLLYKITS